jgi:hypothetical protein
MEWVGALGGVPAVLSEMIMMLLGGYASFHATISIMS